MEQCLHLLIVDSMRRCALAQTIHDGWLLPAVACSERTRATLLAAKWLAGRGLTGVAAGQWLGRVAAGERSIDWLLAIQLSSESASAPVPLSWLPIERLRRGRALLAYQAWAVEAAVGDAIGVSGPFGSLGWMDDVAAWVHGAAGIDATPEACYRASAHEVVLALRGNRRRIYFKGLAADCAGEARALTAASRDHPGSFPATIAIETRPDGSLWWLMAECGGTPMTRPCTPRDCFRVAADVARIQRQTSDGTTLRSAIPTLSVPDALLDAERLLSRADLPAPAREVDAALTRIASLAAGWTPLDLDPVNVFLDESHVRYIDLDARVAPMPLALAIFTQRVLARPPAGGANELVRGMRRAYECEWRGTVPWDALDSVAAVVEIVLGWRRLMRNVARGEVTGPADAMASIVARKLARAWPPAVNARGQ